MSIENKHEILKHFNSYQLDQSNYVHFHIMVAFRLPILNFSFVYTDL